MANANRDIKMTLFVPDTDPISTGPKWERWIEEFRTRLRNFKITSVQDKVDAINIFGGQSLRDQIRSLRDLEYPAPTDEAPAPDAYQKIVDKLNHYFLPMKNIQHARYRFGKAIQNDNETINQYELRLREYASKCDFADTDQQILSHLILTIKDDKFRREALNKRYVLKDFLEKAQAKEDVHIQALEIEGRKDLDSVNRTLTYRKKTGFKQAQARKAALSQTPSNQSAAKCNFCDRHHAFGRNNCPASGKTCDTCGKRGHFAAKCRSKQKKDTSDGNNQTMRTSRKPPPKVKQVVEAQDDDSSSDDDWVKTLSTDEEDKTYSPAVKCELNGVKIKLDVDSCSSANLLDEKRFKMLQDRLPTDAKISLPKPTTNLFAYGNHKIPLVGSFLVKLGSFQTSKVITAKFLVVNGDTKSGPLLSLRSSIDLGLLQINNQKVDVNAINISDSKCNNVENILEEYKDRFERLGKHALYKAKLIIDQSVEPVVQKQRKIPYNLQQKVLQEEKRLQSLGMIEDVPENEPTTWVTNPVIAPKPNNPDEIRYCANMRPPNKAIKRPITELPSVGDIAVKLNGSTVFSKLDMNEGYHQIELEEESRHVTTFYGGNGKKRYTRLNYGTISSQDIFDNIMTKTIGNIPSILYIPDDILVHGKTQQEHNATFLALLRRFRECN